MKYIKFFAPYFYSLNNISDLNYKITTIFSYIVIVKLESTYINGFNNIFYNIKNNVRIKFYDIY